MKERRLWLGLLLALLLSLASCGPRVLSPQAYQELVLETLQGGELEKGAPPLPGLIPSIKKLFDSLYCAESSCKLPSEMQYLGDVADLEREVIEGHRGRICSKRVRPPQEMGSVHEGICDLLERIEHDVDAIKVTAQMAARLLAQNVNDPETLERVSQNFSAKIMEKKAEIIEALRKLREIAWLAPTFADAEAEIPELQAETEREAH